MFISYSTRAQKSILMTDALQIVERSKIHVYNGLRLHVTLFAQSRSPPKRKQPPDHSGGCLVSFADDLSLFYLVEVPGLIGALGSENAPEPSVATTT